ncbi:MAG: peptidase dimerization domain-containing protein, partial [Thermoleophilaceae bacterium]|nr:peptidase dimerization domain-containing protein [Thermoleophilaceae bacterium]
FYEQTGADASLDVNAVAVGQPRTIVPAEATAMVSLRIAPGQDGEELAGALEGLLRAAAPPGADVDLRMTIAHPALFAPDEPAIALAALALERACGVASIFTRSGGSIPIVAGFAARGIPTIVSGFATAEDAFHAPDESYRLESLALGERAAHELYVALASLATRD